MKGRPILKSLAVVAIGALFIVGSAVPAGAAIAGPYIARLDLGPIGVERIEILGVILHESGAVTFMSEHEGDKESAGVGVWEDLGGGLISIGVFSFRYGPTPETSICGVVGVTSPPNNCFLQVGGILMQSGKNFVGELILSIKKKGKNDPVVLGGPLPVRMRPLLPSRFPGATL